MVTKLQYDTFKEAYDEEGERYKELGTASNIFLSLATFFLSGLFFKLDIVLLIAHQSVAAMIALVATWLCFFGALTCTAVSLFVRNFEAPFHPKELLEELDKDKPTDEQFIRSRTIQLAVATDANIKLNDKSATWLQVSQYFIVAGFAAAIAFLIIAICCSVDPGMKK